MNFGEAVEKLKAGRRVLRAGWNGKGMFLFYVERWSDRQPMPGTDGFPCLPFIAMKTADNKVVPWLASQTDVLGEDWELL